MEREELNLWRKSMSHKVNYCSPIVLFFIL